MHLVWGGAFPCLGAGAGTALPSTVHCPRQELALGGGGGGRQASAVGHHPRGLSGEARAQGRRVGSAGGEGPQGPGQAGAVGTKPVVLSWGHRITLSQTSGSSSRNPGSGDLGTPPPASARPGWLQTTRASGPSSLRSPPLSPPASLRVSGSLLRTLVIAFGAVISQRGLPSGCFTSCKHRDPIHKQGTLCGSAWT